MTTKDAYEMGRYVTRHYGTQGARDRQLAMQCFGTADWLGVAYWLGRDRYARTGEY